MNRTALRHRKEPTEAEIQHAAYLLWIEEGRPEGRDLEHWLAAKEMLMHRNGRDARTRHRAPELLVRQDKPRCELGNALRGSSTRCD